jgi:hypothetical protein
MPLADRRIATNAPTGRAQSAVPLFPGRFPGKVSAKWPGDEPPELNSYPVAVIVSQSDPM